MKGSVCLQTLQQQMQPRPKLRRSHLLVLVMGFTLVVALLSEQEALQALCGQRPGQEHQDAEAREGIAPAVLGRIHGSAQNSITHDFIKPFFFQVSGKPGDTHQEAERGV